MTADMTTIPARRGKAVALTRGQEIDVVNTHGQQVLDTWAFNRDDLAEHMSMEHTRSYLSKLTPAVGDRIVTNARRPILVITEDTSPGIHDTLLPACNAAIYRELGCTEYHGSCEDNLHEALAALQLSVAGTPNPFNLFMNIGVNADRTVRRDHPRSKPGDRVRLRAEMDLILVFSACPQDITPINGPDLTPTDAHYAVP